MFISKTAFWLTITWLLLLMGALIIASHPLLCLINGVLIGLLAKAQAKRDSWGLQLRIFYWRTCLKQIDAAHAQGLRELHTAIDRNDGEGMISARYWMRQMEEQRPLVVATISRLARELRERHPEFGAAYITTAR